METKTCSKCKELKPATREFYRTHYGKLRARCKACSNAADRLYERPKQSLTANWQRWYEKNREHQRAKSKEYYWAHREESAARSRKWYQEHSGYARKKDKVKDAAQTAKRKAMKINQTPKDADRVAIQKFYTVSKMLEEQTGTKHHVDHIIPLAHGGLHHQNNLQVLTAEENAKKGASLTDDYIGLRLDQVELALAGAPY